MSVYLCGREQERVRATSVGREERTDTGERPHVRPHTIDRELEEATRAEVVRVDHERGFGEVVANAFARNTC
jgi:hypothetical protein